ncbi:MAG: hypothetical protein J6N67_05535 [Desulfovibrio sp.]|nr:hypothetical protein [Desulfovibrio sp.]
MLLKKCLAVIPAILLLLLSAPVRADMPLSPQALQGAWAGSNGQNTLILMFMGNSCALGLNGQQMAGVWNLNGNRLTMQFQNGKSLSYSAALQGDALILDGNLRLTRQAMPGMPPQGGTWGGGQPNGGTWGQTPQGAPQQSFSSASPLEGTWSTQIPQGRRSFRFTGNRYAQLLNGQVVEEGMFQLLPDGRFQYQVTGGQYAGQTGEDRITLNGNSLTVAWPDGTVVTFTRDSAGSGGTSTPPAIFGGSGQPAPSGAATLLEGRWMWAKQGPVTFGYIFSGNQFIFLWNGAEKSRGTFSLSGMQLTMRHESGPEAGKTDVLGYQLNGNRLLIFTSQDPNMDPIPFVRQ